MTSVERVLSYTQIEQEPGYAYHSQPPENWPQNGQITAKNLSLVYYQGGPILGDPGAVSGGGKKSKRARKNSGEEKSRRRRRAPGNKVLKDQFQTVRLVLASDWCQKTFLFFCPIAEQQDQESFRVLLHDRYIQASCSPCYFGVRHLQTADLQTCRLADLQTCRLADLQTCRLADLQTCRLADLQTCRLLADLQTWRVSTPVVLTQNHF